MASTTATNKKFKGFTDEERAPMRERAMAKRLHAIIKESAPALSPKTWYGMTAYAKDDKIVCFFQNAKKFKARYATLGFNDVANLDEGAMWPFRLIV